MKQAMLLLLCLCAGLPFGLAFGEEKPHDLSTETKAEVPALEAMHEVIYPLWHTAWPNQDTTLMIQLFPDIVKNAEAVTKSDLPGILRDKKLKWNNGVQALNTTVDELKSAIEKHDQKAMLDATENLHRNFEILVRIVTPVIKELEAFHEVLYPLYHYYVAKYDYSKVKHSVLELKQKTDALNAVQLPERMKKREERFIAARKALSDSVDELQKAVESKSEKPIKAAVEKMHTAYQEVEKVFD